MTDHASVLYAISKIKTQSEVYDDVKNDIEILSNLITDKLK